MDKKDLIMKLLEKCKERFKEAEVYKVNGENIEIGIYKGEIDKYSVSQSGGLSLRGLKDGKMGYSYMEILDEAKLDDLVEEAYSNGLFLDIVDEENIFGAADKYEEVNLFNQDLISVPIEDKIEFAKNLEKEAYAQDKRVVNVQNCFYQEFQEERTIINTKGLDLKDRVNGAIGYLSVVVKDGEDTKTGSSYKIFSNFSKDNYKDIAKEAVEEAISQLGAKPIKSGKYPIIIRNRQVASLIQSYLPIFRADMAEKGLSLLKDKEGEVVGNPLLSLIDDPYYEDGFASRAFDDEGTRTEYRKVIDKGRLTTLLHNQKTARKANVASTGNGSRPSYKSSVGIAPSNFYIAQGDKNFDQLLKDVDHGVYITSLAGLHSGINTISGDFSLSASGFEIVKGKVERPINQITISGNIYSLFKDIEAVGNDLIFNFPGNSQYGSPSIKVKELSIAGE